MAGFGPAQDAPQGPGPAQSDRWWGADDGRQEQATGTGDEFPRIIRTRLRG